ncbi:MAG: hypothetical protein J6R98_02930 [Bacteroidaceae bacterium]|nr:hypothetical protein [Bacteroidaceae bacterium]
MKNISLKSPLALVLLGLIYTVFIAQHLFFHNSLIQLPFPVALLTLLSLFTCPVVATLFFLFSALGDWGGATGQFLPQMGAFATAHIMLIIYLAMPFRTIKGRLLDLYSSHRIGFYFQLLASLALLAVVFTRIVPVVPAGILSIGVSVYSILILIMWNLSMMHQSYWIKIGATLFLISDFILAWNRFVSPVEMARLQILVPYFLAQGCLFIGISLCNFAKKTKGII